MSHYDRFGEVYDGETVDDEYHATYSGFEQGTAEADPNESITMDEIGNLLAACVARDQRTTSTADVLAWYEDLNLACVTYGDASAALSYYYVHVWPKQDEGRRFRATAPILIELVRKQRSERLEGFYYEPGPTDIDATGAQYIQTLRARKTEVGNGALKLPALPPARKESPVMDAIEAFAAGRALPQDVVDQVQRDLGRLPEPIAAVIKPLRNPARLVRCPSCKATVGESCTSQGKPLGGGKRVHPSRTDAFAKSSTACPACLAAPGADCTQVGPGDGSGGLGERVGARGVYALAAAERLALAGAGSVHFVRIEAAAKAAPGLDANPLNLFTADATPPSAASS